MWPVVPGEHFQKCSCDRCLNSTGCRRDEVPKPVIRRLRLSYLWCNSWSQYLCSLLCLAKSLEEDHHSLKETRKIAGGLGPGVFGNLWSKSLQCSLKILPSFWENLWFCLVEAMEMGTVADGTANKMQS